MRGTVSISDCTGVEYEGEIFQTKQMVSPMDYTVGLVSMIALVGLLIITMRD